MIWLADNWQGVMTIFTALLGVAVSVSHLLHKDSVASQIQNLEDIIAKLGQPK